MFALFFTLFERGALVAGVLTASGSGAVYYLPFLPRLTGACCGGSVDSSLLRVCLLPLGSSSGSGALACGVTLAADLLLPLISFFSAFGAFSFFVPFSAAAIYFFIACISPLFLLLALPLTTLRRLSVRSCKTLSFWVRSSSAFLSTLSSAFDRDVCI